MSVVDLCIGAFTKNRQRTLVSTFVEMGVTSEYLIVGGMVSSKTTAQMIKGIFAPFSPSLWVTTFGVLILLSFLFVVQESSSWSEFKKAPLATAGFAAYNASLGFFAQEGITNDDPLTWGGRFTFLAIAVQILLAGASYTANLTNFLVRNGFETSVESIEDAIGQQLQVCVLRNKMASLDNIYGKDVIQYAINRKCSVAQRSAVQDRKDRAYIVIIMAIGTCYFLFR